VPSQGYWEDGKKVGEYPAMAHLVSDKDGNPATWHITYLTERGEKAPVFSAKKLMTPSRDWKGGAIRLCCKYSDGKTLGIAEGVETALACADWLGHPVWAAVNANNLAAFEPPEWVERLVIFADNDGTFTGQAAAFELARRMKVKRKMKTVEVEIPIEQETDFADELAG
jgi:putative DNA primase/helicase